MFSSSSPIWCFLNALGATFKDPEQARLATKGLYLMEDPDTGYMVTPASLAVRDCLTREARKRSVLIDGASVA